jgi:hypothetical protein
VRDHPWPLLALLAALAGRPLDSDFRETPELLALLYHPGGICGGGEGTPGGRSGKQQRATPRRSAWRAAVRRRSSGSSDEGGRSGGGGGSGSDVDPYGCPSDLSDWSEEGESEGAAGAADEAGGRAAACWANGSGTEAPGADETPLPRCGLAARAPAGPAAPAPELFARRAVPAGGDLLPMLAAARLGPAAPWLAPGAGRCYPQRVLAAGALAALQGDVAEGFIVDAASGRLAVDAEVTTPCLSPGALRALLSEFAEAGSCARGLRHLARRLCCSGNNASGGVSSGSGGSAGAEAHFGFPVTPCLRAFGAALSEQLAAQGAQLAGLQQRLLLQVERAGGCRGGGVAGVDTDAGALAAARRAASGCIERLHLLQSVVDGVVAEIGGPAPQASASLLDCLYRRLAAGDPALSGPAGEGAAGALLHLLLSSMMPLLGALGRWLYGGREGGGEGGGAEDFFVLPAVSLPVQDPRFWSQAFALARGGGGGAEDAAEGAQPAEGAVCCPSFLAPLAEGILSAGKSLRLMRYMQQEELAAAPLQMIMYKEEGGGGRRGPGGKWARSGGGGAVGWARRRGGGASPSREAQSRSGWRGGRGPGACAGGASAAATSAEAAGGRAGEGDDGSVRMSAAVRLQLAVAAAAAAHGEDGEAFQLRFAEAACDLLRQWDRTLPPQPGPVASAAASAAARAGGSPWQGGAGAPPPPLLLLMPGAGGGCGDDPRSSECSPACAAAGAPGGCSPRQQQQEEAGQPGMLQALEAAGRALRCPGSLLGCGGASRRSAAAELLLPGLAREEPMPSRSGRGPPAAAQQSPVTAAAAAVMGVGAIMGLNPPASANAAGAAAAAAAQGEEASSQAGGGPQGGGAIPPLAAWGAALREDLAAADSALQRLVPRGGAAAGCDAARKAVGALALAMGVQGWGGGGGGDGADAADDTAAVADASGSGHGEGAGPAEWPAELWPLRGAGAAAGARWLAAPLAPQRRLAWLLSRPPRFVGPVQMLLERALLEPLQERVSGGGVLVTGGRR